MVKGGADNRKHRQQRRRKRKNVFTGITPNKLSKIENICCDENVDVPPAVTASVTAVSVATPTESNITTSSSSAAFHDEDSEWVDVEEEIRTVSEKKIKKIPTGRS